MMYPTLLLVATFPLLLFYFLYKNKKNTENFPPGPKGLPIIGNLHQFSPNNPHLYFHKLSKIYGPITFLRLGRVPVVAIQSAKAAKEVLKTQDGNFCSRPMLVGQQKLSYNGLDIGFTRYGPYHREIRKLSMVHLFSSKRVHSFAPIRRDEVLRMVHEISTLSSKSKVIDLSDLLMSLTCSIICRIAFSKRYEDEGLERSRFHRLMHDAQAMLAVPYFSDYIPIIGNWIDKVTGQSSRLERVFKQLDVFYDEIIKDHLLQQDDNSKTEDDREDIVDVLLQLRKQRTFGFDLTLDNIKALLMNIILAGTDTSAAVVVWAMTELIKNPTIMKKAQNELRNLIRDKNLVEEDDLPMLNYLMAIVKETFRLHPPAPLLIVREAIQKCTLEGYEILPKTQVFVNIWTIGRDPASWKNPEIFMPERFLGSESSIDYRGNDFELLPFGAGRRMCPAMLLGVANVELTLANLLHSFDWELPDGMDKNDIDTDMMPGITMHKKNPLCLVAKSSSIF